MAPTARPARQRVLKTERLILRHLTPNDHGALFAVLGDPFAMKFYPRPFDEDMTKSWIQWTLDHYENHGFGLWAVVLGATGECIGDCGLTLQRIDGIGEIEVGYHLQRKHWKQGYATEGARAYRDYLFDTLKKDRLVSWTRPENVPSRRVMERIGLTFEKESPDRYGAKQVVYSMSRAQYETVKP
jgi:RimJ/RimL family protein N-acetyltransferase